jgi:hypothetical protein
MTKAKQVDENATPTMDLNCGHCEETVETIETGRHGGGWIECKCGAKTLLSGALPPGTPVALEVIPPEDEGKGKKGKAKSA